MIRSQRKASSVKDALSFTVLLSVMTFAGMPSVLAMETKWGTVKGQFLFDCVVPTLPPLVKAVPGVVNQDVPDEKLVVDADTKGIASIIIYLPRRPDLVHPDFEQRRDAVQNEASDDEVSIDVKNHRFVPHAMIVRTSQKIRLLNDDFTTHNFAIAPIRNAPPNIILVKPNDRKGVVLQPMTFPKKIPIKVTSMIHVWMGAYILIVDHPYAAVTGKDGRFEIRNLPVGNHEFRIWHEAVGYLEKKYVVTIKEGENPQKPMKIKPEQILK